MKGRFRSLQGLRANLTGVKDFEGAVRWVEVSVILHNMLIDWNDPWDDVWYDGDERDVPIPADIAHEVSGDQKRSRIKHQVLLYRGYYD